MNIAKRDAAGTLPALQVEEGELMNVLRNSLYPGARDESIKLVLGYCRAAGLDPMQKPVHIVPMKVSTGQKDDRGWDIKENRDVIMPGIGLYRTQAARTSQYAGVTEPDFGPAKQMKFTETTWEEDERGKRQKRQVEAVVEYPEWCRVTVKRVVGDQIVEFTAREYWLENYATKSASSQEPNAMWKRRPFGQLAKCAEAQALRKAFPEFGSQPTADEMEGLQALDLDEPTQTSGKQAVEMPKARPKQVTQQTGETLDQPEARSERQAEPVTRQERSARQAMPDNGFEDVESSDLATEGEKKWALKKLAGAEVAVAVALEACGLSVPETLDGLTRDGFVSLQDYVRENC